jgi:hypothetical protein
MDGVFFAGLALGSILGLAVDLWKRPLDRLLDRRVENRATTRATELSARLANDRQGLRDFLMVQILETTLIGSLAGILSGILFAVTNANIGYNLERILPVLGQVIAIAAAGMIVRIASDAISVARKVADFTDPGPVDRPSAEGTTP